MGQGLRLGIPLGVVFGFVATLVVAEYISQNYGHRVDGFRSDAGGLPLVGWVRGGGDLRVSHFFTMHLMRNTPQANLL